MKISVITPSLNQAGFIEATIRSVLNQGFSALEYIVIDGGSTDGTQAILEKYGDRLRWLSEPDRGQSDAINKGMRMARGDILAYLNADDLYLPDTFARVAEYFSQNPEVQWVYGDCRVIDEQGQTLGQLTAPRFDVRRMIYRAEYVPQPTVFWRKEIAMQVGEFDVSLRYSMDYEYFIRLGQYAPGHRLNAELACFRLQSTSKTMTGEEIHWCETLHVSERYGMKPWTPWYWIRRARHYGWRWLPAPLWRAASRALGRTQDTYQETLTRQ